MTQALLASVIVCEPLDQLGEGPLWDHRTGRLLWVDILRGRVHAWSAEAGLRDLLRLDGMIGSVALAGRADLLVASTLGLLRWSAASGEMELLANPIAGQPARFNDGRVDTRGRFWVGTMALDPDRYAEPLGALYRFDPDGSIHQMEEGLTISNGLDWSPDDKTFYLTDTMRRSIFAYDFDAARGAITHRRTFVQPREADGYPDGLVVDANGHVWSACFGGSGICHYDPAGRLVEKINLPVSCPTALTFGGVDYSSVFITTSQHTLGPDHRECEAGSLLGLTLLARGRPAAVFGAGGSP